MFKEYFVLFPINISTIIGSIVISIAGMLVKNWGYKYFNKNKINSQKINNIEIEVHYQIVKDLLALEQNQLFTKSKDVCFWGVFNLFESSKTKQEECSFCLSPLSADALIITGNTSMLYFKNNSNNSFEILEFIDKRKNTVSLKNMRPNFLAGGETLCILINTYDAPQSVRINHNGTIFNYELAQKYGFLKPIVSEF